LKRFIAALALTSAIGIASSAQAITIDGSLDAAYGATTATVAYNPAAPTSNFAAPTAASNAIGYTIHLTSDANYVYGFLQTFGPGASVGDFANLYFDLDPANGNGSDIGFEVTNYRGFVAGGSGYSPVALNFFASGGIVEFSIPNSYFLSAMTGLESQYGVGFPFPSVGDQVTLRLSQSFGYSVAGGASYGPNRLGSVILGGGAIPEPATWAMMLLGFGGVGALLRNRKRQAAFA
jgi:hypothetical protein